MDFWNDKDMLDFARVATEGAYGKYRNCKKLIDKLNKYKMIKSIILRGRAPFRRPSLKEFGRCLTEWPSD